MPALFLNNANCPLQKPSFLTDSISAAINKNTTWLSCNQVLSDSRTPLTFPPETDFLCPVSHSNRASGVTDTQRAQRTGNILAYPCKPQYEKTSTHETMQSKVISFRQTASCAAQLQLTCDVRLTPYAYLLSVMLPEHARFKLPPFLQSDFQKIPQTVQKWSHQSIYFKNKVGLVLIGHFWSLHFTLGFSHVSINEARLFTSLLAPLSEMHWQPWPYRTKCEWDDKNHINDVVITFTMTLISNNQHSIKIFN